jgi:hypothetical protein
LFFNNHETSHRAKANSQKIRRSPDGTTEVVPFPNAPWFRFFRAVTVFRAPISLAIALLAGCGEIETPPTPPTNIVDLAVTGQTVTKVCTAGSEVVLLEERLTSIFEDGPQRTLAILESDHRTVQPYTPSPPWSVVDFAVHPSGDISAILTTARGSAHRAPRSQWINSQ